MSPVHMSNEAVCPRWLARVAVMLLPLVLIPPAIRIQAADTKALIAEAYEKTKSAATIADYESIIELCEEARRNSLSQAQETYVKSLLSWSHNRRGELFTEQASQLHSEGKTNEATAADAQALSDFEAAIELDSGRWKPWHNRGVSRAIAGKYKEAISDFTRVIQLNPTYPNAWFNRGEIQFDLGKLDEALNDYSEAIRLDPKDAGAYTSRAHTYFQLRKYREAFADYSQVIQLVPNDAVAHVNRGDAYQSLGQWQQAVEDFNEAVKLDPESPRVLQSAAWLLATCPDENLRDAKVAVAAAEKAIELLGTADPLYLDTLAAAYANAGRFDEAIAKIHEALPRVATNDATRLKQRLALYQQKRPYRQATSTTATPSNPTRPSTTRAN